MPVPFRSLFAVAIVVSASMPAQQAPPPRPANELEFRLGSASIRRWSQDGIPRATWQRDERSPPFELRRPDDRLWFAAAVFDPRRERAPFDGALAAPAGTRLHVVQFHTQVLIEYRRALGERGIEVLEVLPSNALLVRADAAPMAALGGLPWVRWHGPLPNGCKLDAELRGWLLQGGAARDVNLVLADRRERAQLVAAVGAAGGEVTELGDGSLLLVARLDAAAMAKLLATDLVVSADPSGPSGRDMDHARVQGGADHLEAVANYRGQGVVAEVTEFFEETHPDLVGRAFVRGPSFDDAHGHCTAGILGGSGAGNALARGMMPDCTLIENGYFQGSQHYAQIRGSVDPNSPLRSMQATASWGSPSNASYTSISKTLDDALFTFDFVRTQSMGNAGTNLGVRPEAWAKNIIAVGGVRHQDNALPGDDVWSFGASTGPSADGRLKPEVCAYFDSVLTSDRTGAAGYAPGDWFAGFSGTSAATPIVSGHLGLLQQLFTDGVFGNPLPQPATAAFRFENRPHMTTAKALLCNTAEQYAFSGVGADLARTRQGWGFPSLRRAWDQRDRLVVLDEYDALQLGESRRYLVHVAPNTPEFRVTIVWADPAAPVPAAFTLINDLDLKVTRAADGVAWWGNHGLDSGNVSLPGGAPNRRDNLEAVYLQNPTPGLYFVTVTAAMVAQDAKLETPAADVDFALVMHPMGGGYRTSGGMTLALQTAPGGQLVFAPSAVPATGWTEGYLAVSLVQKDRLGFGAFFGVELDALGDGLLTTPAAVGNPFHFPRTPGSYPFANLLFPYPAWVSVFAGNDLDAVLVLLQGDEVVAVSNVARARLR
ncbi:MAG: S8 family serine peptidase [Planctomycetes bacterium]|nr:S8 family serine peptidase [Planctomycetota bacterium]